MPPLPRIFIASASEGLDVARQAQRSLQARLRGHAEVVLWPEAFDLSATYIESLERALTEFDFALLVASGADRTRSRGREAASPRDNVVFEAGLFMGRLGRNRCFVLKPAAPALRLPSDLTGVACAGYAVPDSAEGWPAALAPACERIAGQVRALGLRRRLSLDALATQEAIHLFVQRIAGAWWERITALEDSSVLSFFTLEPDPLFNSVTLRGQSYGEDGQLAAYWRSEMARVDIGRREVHYHWTGWHPDRSAHADFLGVGVLQFSSADAGLGSQPVIDGHGRFWDVDETRPDRTRVKPVELRRIADEATAHCMAHGQGAARRACVLAALAHW